MAGAQVAGIGSGHDERQLREDFVTACHILVNENVAEAAFNVSCRLPGRPHDGAPDYEPDASHRREYSNL